MSPTEALCGDVKEALPSSCGAPPGGGGRVIKALGGPLNFHLQSSSHPPQLVPTISLLPMRLRVVAATLLQP